MAPPIRWLHLSDFHVGKDDYAGRKMFDYITAHVKRRNDEGFAPDFIFITGDLANKGLTSEYEDFWLEFMLPLQEILGNNIAQQTFVVPGNHDVDRNHNQAFGREEMLSGSSHHFDPTEIGMKARQMLLPRFQAFNENDLTSVRGGFAGIAGAFSSVRNLHGKTIGIAGINTAWLCKDEHDDKKLTPGKAIVEHALNALKDTQLRIVLGHHPIEWLLPVEQKLVKTLFGQNAVIYLHGHLHEEWAEPTYGGGHQFLTIQSGAAFQAREREKWRNGFVWGEADLESAEIRLQPRRWISAQQAWVPATDAFHESYRRGDWWHYPMPGTELAKKLVPASVLPVQDLPHNLPPVESDTPNRAPKTFLSKLPITSGPLFGRSGQLDQLDKAWVDPDTNILILTAWGGVGKTALVSHWLDRLQQDNYAGAKSVYAESFYSRGPEEVQRTSADGFLVEALHWFGETNYDRHPAWDRGIRLAELVRQERVLLILDGLESLQYPPGELQGRLKDRGMQALLRELARGNTGLCIVTTRVEIGDLRDIRGTAVMQVPLENLSPSAGAKLLRNFSLNGTEKELEEASEEFKGHALALTLLGTYLAAAHGHDIARRDHIKSLESIPEAEGRHARRVMESYERWLNGMPELEILRLLGLFDHPVDSAVLTKLRSPPVIDGVTNGICALTEDQCHFAIKHLRDLRLVETAERGAVDTIDCHPLVREHFGALLKAQYRKGWEEAHERLFHYYLGQVKKLLLETLRELEPAFRAIVHGCLAGKVREALNLYVMLIQRDGEVNYCCKVLGAVGADLAVLSAFFEVPWTVPLGSIDVGLHGILINWAGYRLQSLGRIREALECDLISRDLLVAANDVLNARAISYALCQLSLVLGQVERAVAFGKQGVADVPPSRKALGQDDIQAVLGHALHQAGEIDAAGAHFLKAEALQNVVQPKSGYLYSLRGYYFCDLLIDLRQYDEVHRRARQSLRIAESNKLLLDTALAKLTLGRNALFSGKTKTDDLLRVAEKYLNEAVRGLIEAGTYHHLPRGFFARSQLYRLTNRFREAWRDLDDMFEITDRGEMKLFLADFHLEAARTALAERHVQKAREHLTIGSKVVHETGYRRRIAEVETLRMQLDGRMDEGNTTPLHGN